MRDNELRKVAQDRSRPREERREAILKLLEQPSPAVPGVSQGDRWGGRIRPWQSSLTEPGTAGPSLRLRDMSVPIPADAFPKPQIRTRSAQERQQAMMARYQTMLDQGQLGALQQILDPVLEAKIAAVVKRWKKVDPKRERTQEMVDEVQALCWASGVTVTAEKLRQAASDGLQRAEMEAKRVGYRKITKEPWEQ